MWKAIIFGGDSEVLCGLPQCKIYCRLDWVSFLRAFTRHLKHCQEYDFWMLWRLPLLSFIFPSPSYIFEMLCRDSYKPHSFHGHRQGCTFKPQHTTVEIYPLKPEPCKCWVAEWGLRYSSISLFGEHFCSYWFKKVKLSFFGFFSTCRQAKAGPPPPFMGLPNARRKLELDSAKYTRSWNLRDYWNGNSGPLLLRRCFIGNELT